MLDPKTTHAMDQYLGEMEELIEFGLDGLNRGETDDTAATLAKRITRKTKRDTTLLLVLALTQMAEDRWRAEHRVGI